MTTCTQYPYDSIRNVANVIKNIRNQYPASYFIRQMKDDDSLYTSNFKIRKNAEMMPRKLLTLNEKFYEPINENFLEVVIP